MKTIEPCLPKKELAKYLGISERTVDRYVVEGMLPRGMRLKRKLIWRRDIVDRWLGMTEYERACEKERLESAYYKY